MAAGHSVAATINGEQAHMNVRTLIIRFGIGTLVSGMLGMNSIAASATDRPLNKETLGLAATSSTSVSADITASQEPLVAERGEQDRRDADRASGELQLAEDMARKLEDHLQRRLAAQLNSVI